MTTTPTYEQLEQRIKELEKECVERKRALEELQGALETAGDICHEMNQPVMAISGYSELVLMDMPENSPFREKVVKIKVQSDRLAAITQGLMKITRHAP